MINYSKVHLLLGNFHLWTSYSRIIYPREQLLCRILTLKFFWTSDYLPQRFCVLRSSYSTESQYLGQVTPGFCTLRLKYSAARDLSVSVAVNAVQRGRAIKFTSRIKTSKINWLWLNIVFKVFENIQTVVDPKEDWKLDKTNQPLYIYPWPVFLREKCVLSQSWNVVELGRADFMRFLLGTKAVLPDLDFSA